MEKTMSNGAEKTRKGGPEVAQKFVPTPERLSQVLDRKAEEVQTQLASVEGRKQLSQDIQKHEKDIRKLDPTFNVKELERQLDLVGETLRQKEKFMKDVKSPEKKGFFRKAWDSVKGFAKKHPIVTTLLVLALAAAGIAGAAYMAGGFEALLSKVGIGHLYGAGGASKAAEVTGKVLQGGADLPNHIFGPTGPLKW